MAFPLCICEMAPFFCACPSRILARGGGNTDKTARSLSFKVYIVFVEISFVCMATPYVHVQLVAE